MDVPKEFKESLDKEQEELKNLSPEELAALNDKIVAAARNELTCLDNFEIQSGRAIRITKFKDLFILPPGSIKNSDKS
jgi:hypothetical protein